MTLQKFNNAKLKNSNRKIETKPGKYVQIKMGTVLALGPSSADGNTLWIMYLYLFSKKLQPLYSLLIAEFSKIMLPDGSNFT